MKVAKYYISDSNGKSNCIIRSFCKLYDEEYINVYNELCNIAKEIGSNSYNDIEVFETYMKNHKTINIKYGKDIKIKDLNLELGKYIIFCWDKKDYYHMITIINNTIYDKDDKCLELYTIKIYKQV